MTKFRRSIWALLAASVFGVGCGDDDNGNGDGAFLTIIGDDQIFAESGAIQQLTVRYHDDDNNPLAGTVSFLISGDAAGSELSVDSVVTGSDGMAKVDLVFGEVDEAAFQVIAEASDASPARWSVALTAPDFEVAGRYTVDSQFSMPEGIEALGALNTFLDITNDPNDPATWLLDQIEDQLSGAEQSVFTAARITFGLDQTLNGFLLSSSPQFVNGLVELGDDLDQVVRALGLRTELEISGDDVEASFGADHEVTGAIFWLDGDRYDYTKQQIGFADVEALDVGLTLPQKTRLNILSHTLHLPYGDLLVFAIDEVIVPLHDPFASSLSALVAGWVDCEAVGAEIADITNVNSAQIFEIACVAGIDLALDRIMSSFADIEADLTISGSTTLMDGDKDRMVEKLHNGEWEGELVFEAGTVALPRPDQKFVGQRIGQEQ